MSILKDAATLKRRLDKLDTSTTKKLEAATNRITEKHDEKKSAILSDYPAEVQSLLATAAELESEAG
jgi:hypothetical protein